MDAMEGIEDFFGYNNLIDDDETHFPDFPWSNPNPPPSFHHEIQSSSNSVIAPPPPLSQQTHKKDHSSRKRGRTESSCGSGPNKACREKQRRERLNDKLLDLSAVLEPGRPAKTDKPAILDDAIRVVTQLRAEMQELTETNEKLLEEIKSLKAEKSELREEKNVLKVEKERLGQQLKSMTIPPSGFLPAHPVPPAYQPGASKMVYPSYGMFPMWHYLPPSTRDTSRDHELRPPAA